MDQNKEDRKLNILLFRETKPHDSLSLTKRKKAKALN